MKKRKNVYRTNAIFSTSFISIFLLTGLFVFKKAEAIPEKQVNNTYSISQDESKHIYFDKEKLKELGIYDWVSKEEKVDDVNNIYHKVDLIKGLKSYLHIPNFVLKDKDFASILQYAKSYLNTQEFYLKASCIGNQEYIISMLNENCVTLYPLDFGYNGYWKCLQFRKDVGSLIISVYYDSISENGLIQDDFIIRYSDKTIEEIEFEHNENLFNNPGYPDRIYTSGVDKIVSYERITLNYVTEDSESETENTIPELSISVDLKDYNLILNGSALGNQVYKVNITYPEYTKLKWDMFTYSKKNRVYLFIRNNEMLLKQCLLSKYSEEEVIEIWNVISKYASKQTAVARVRSN